jgi:hypothetical protein
VNGDTLALAVTSQLAALPSPWTSSFRTAIQLAGLRTNLNYSISINGLPPLNSTNYPTGLIPILVQTNGAVSLATPEVVLDPSALVIPPSGTGTCAVVLSDPAPADGTMVTFARVDGDTNIVLAGTDGLVFNATNWNLRQTVAFTSPRGTNWQNRATVFQVTAPGFTGQTLPITDEVRIAPRLALTNGSFEVTSTLYSPAIGGLALPVGWTNLSGLNYQASSMLKGAEGTAASGATGSRILRLVSDLTTLYNQGCIAQHLGAMLAGETYTLTADALGGTGDGSDNLWGATAAFVNEVAFNPGKFYASQMVTNVLPGQVLGNAFSFSYTAQPADDGKPLVVWLKARLVSNDTSSIRGGVDNVRLTITPLPPTPVILGFSGPTAGFFFLSGTTDVAGILVTEKTTNLAVPVVWTFIQSNPAPGGSFSFQIPQGSDSAAFFRLRGE